MLGIASSFGTSALPAGGALDSRAIKLSGVHPESGPVIVKLIGTDARGHRVAAWAEINNQMAAGDSADHLPLTSNPG